MRCQPIRYGVKLNTVSEAVSIWPKIIGWWERDETSGTTMLDSHTNALHGTYNLILPSKIDEAPLATNIGRAVKYDSTTGSYTEVADNAHLKPTGNLSVMLWAKRNGAQADTFPKLVWKPSLNNAGGQANYMLSYVSSTNKLSWRVTVGGVNQTIEQSGSMADMTSYFIVGNRAGSALDLYLNASLDNSAVIASGAADTSTQALRHGYYGFSALDKWNGWQDQTAIFNEVLTQAEIDYIYNGGAGVSYATMKADSGN